MALSSPNALPLHSSFFSHFRNPNPNSSFLFPNQRNLRSSTASTTVLCVLDGRNLTPRLAGVPVRRPEDTKLYYRVLIQIATSAILFVGISARACSAMAGKLPDVSSPACQTVEEERIGGSAVNMENHVTGTSDIIENIEDKELRTALESWKSKTYALTVPLRVVALRGSIPPSWIKEFMQSQGRRLKLNCEFRGSLNEIFSDLFSSSSKGMIEPRSAMAADIITIGDSWLGLGIQKGLVVPIQDVEGQDWFKGLSEKWKEQ